jgi:ArsR family transcriptional regulator
MINRNEHCCKQIHPQVVDSVRKALTDDHQFRELARFFKTFRDSTRLKVLTILGKSEICVCDIAAVLGMRHCAISDQLALLSWERLVKHRRELKRKGGYYLRSRE